MARMRSASSVRARLIRLSVGLSASVALAACATAPIAPTYSQAELKAECERHGFWWHPDDLTGGFCEHDSQM
jgi:hypothetical protein